MAKVDTAVSTEELRRRVAALEAKRRADEDNRRFLAMIGLTIAVVALARKARL